MSIPLFWIACVKALPDRPELLWCDWRAGCKPDQGWFVGRGRGLP
ncbi:MAG: hypothetical protein ACI9IV_001582 [Paracoccaceae bacterium]|jgi:hypothetical protein